MDRNDDVGPLERTMTSFTLKNDEMWLKGNQRSKGEAHSTRTVSLVVKTCVHRFVKRLSIIAGVQPEGSPISGSTRLPWDTSNTVSNVTGVVTRDVFSSYRQDEFMVHLARLCVFMREDQPGDVRGNASRL